MTPREKWLQRNARRIITGLVCMLVAVPMLAVWITLVAIGVHKPVDPSEQRSGNVTCWMDADGNRLMCGDVEYRRVKK